jgi:hypothetical protein
MKQITLYATCGLFLLGTTVLPVHAEEQPALMNVMRTEERQTARARGRVNRTLLFSEENPCAGLQGLQKNECIRDLRIAGKWADSSGHRVRSFPAENRRLAALKARAKRRKGILIPRHIGENRNIDLRFTPRERFRASTTLNTSFLREQTARRSLLPGRAKAGLRKAGTRTTSYTATRPLCGRREGISLINCLNALGIQINDRTTDEGTLEIWRSIQEQGAE